MFGTSTRISVVKNVLRQIHDNAKLLEGVTEVVNRNPRNLERLRIARKPQGYHLDIQENEYWHKLVIVKHGRYVSAEVHHFENGPVITAGSNEPCIKHQLYRPQDTAAYYNIGRVLAERCLRSGINMLYCPPSENTSPKRKTLCDALTEGGIILEEYERYLRPVASRGKWPEKTWETFE